MNPCSVSGQRFLSAKICQAHKQDWPSTIILEEASFWQHGLGTSHTLVSVLFPERSSQGVSRVQLILSVVFFHPGYNFPFPSRDGIVIMENLGLKKKKPQWKNTAWNVVHACNWSAQRAEAGG